MLLHGDELGRTQDGNNNTYAQDSEISWVHWDEADRPLVEFTAAVARLRHQHPTFRRKRFFTGTTVRAGDGARATGSTTSSGCTPTAGRWRATTGPPRAPGSIGMYLNGHGIAGTDAVGNPITDAHFLLYFNAGGDAVELTLPPEEYSAGWDVLIDTAGATTDDRAARRPVGSLKLEARSVVVLREQSEPVAEADHSVAASVAAMARPVARRTPRTQRD